VQFEAQEGPGVNAIVEHATFRTGDLVTEERWPRFASRAAELGINSMLSFRLFVTETTLGSLNLYSSRRNAFSRDAENDGQLFASHAAVALVCAQHEAQLNDAIKSRDVIGMAKGILMHRHGVDCHRAFGMLAESSQQTNIKLRDVATWVVEHGQEL